MAVSRSPLRYRGSKGSWIKKLLPILPTGNSLCEPFCGGGSLGLTLLRKGHIDELWLNDTDPCVADFFITLRDRGEELTEAARELRERLSSPRLCVDFYLGMKRLLRSRSLSPVERALAYYGCNRVSWGGVTTSTGTSGVGVFKRFTFTAIEELTAWSDHLQGVQVTNLDYRTVLARIPDNMTIFFDPPYEKVVDGRKLDLYWASEFDLRKFAEELVWLDQLGKRWVVTLMLGPEMKKHFGDLLWQSIAHVKMVEIEVKHKMHRRSGTEIVIWNTGGIFEK